MLESEKPTNSPVSDVYPIMGVTKGISQHKGKTKLNSVGARTQPCFTIFVRLKAFDSSPSSTKDAMPSCGTNDECLAT